MDGVKDDLVVGLRLSIAVHDAEILLNVYHMLRQQNDPNHTLDIYGDTLIETVKYLAGILLDSGILDDYSIRPTQGYRGYGED